MLYHIKKDKNSIEIQKEKFCGVYGECTMKKKPKYQEKDNKCSQAGGEKGVLCPADGTVNWCSHCEKQHGGFLKKLKTELKYDPAISLLGLDPKEIKTGSKTAVFSPTFTAALFTM